MVKLTQFCFPASEVIHQEKRAVRCGVPDKRFDAVGARWPETRMGRALDCHCLCIDPWKYPDMSIVSLRAIDTQ